jgi:hypothetical protein
MRGDSLVKGGYGNIASGGSVAGNAPEAWSAIAGHWNNGIDFTAATFASAAINFSSTNSSSATATGGAVALPANAAGFIKMAISGTVVKVPYYND